MKINFIYMSLIIQKKKKLFFNLIVQFNNYLCIFKRKENKKMKNIWIN